MKFHRCWSPGKCFWSPSGKIYHYPPGKSPSDAHARLCVDQGFLNAFADVPKTIK